ncbi:Gfo/Idh/MocA family oxidoreductase [Streptomyces sp. NPDC047981]|uniref:Gfo/Idh/MocA family protein n=1 Tax=Streptomyces sp. NPDC047981 TaxID=3154610 RepID=UPI00342DC9A5
MATRFGLVGSGIISEEHALSLRQIPDAAELTAVFDVVRENAERFAAHCLRTHGIEVEVAKSLDALLARDDVDAVSVCTPSGTHEDIAVRCLTAGRHVLVEKPLGMSVASVDRIIAARDASGMTAGVVSQHRFTPGNAAVRRAVEEGRFGRLTSGSAAVNWYRSQAYYDSAGWRGTRAMDGGALMNQGIHTLDLLCWFLGEPVEVYAHSGCLAHERVEVEDTVTATVRFAGGASATVLATTAAYPGTHVRLHVNGDRGMAVLEAGALKFFHAAPDGHSTDDPPYDPGTGLDTAEQELGRGGTSGGTAAWTAHALQMRDFAQAAHEGRQPAVTLEDGRRTVALIEAVEDSARTGRPIRLDPPPSPRGAHHEKGAFA